MNPSSLSEDIKNTTVTQLPLWLLLRSPTIRKLLKKVHVKKEGINSSSQCTVLLFCYQKADTSLVIIGFFILLSSLIPQANNTMNITPGLSSVNVAQPLVYYPFDCNRYSFFLSKNSESISTIPAPTRNSNPNRYVPVQSYAYPINVPDTANPRLLPIRLRENALLTSSLRNA